MLSMPFSQILQAISGTVHLITCVFKLLLFLGSLLISVASTTLAVLSYVSDSILSSIAVLAYEFGVFVLEFSDITFSLTNALVTSVTSIGYKICVFGHSLWTVLGSVFLEILSLPIYAASLVLRFFLGIKDAFVLVGDSIALISYKGPAELIGLFINFLKECKLVLIHSREKIFALAMTCIISVWSAFLSAVIAIIDLQFQDFRFVPGWLILFVTIYCLKRLNTTYPMINTARRFQRQLQQTGFYLLRLCFAAGCVAVLSLKNAFTRRRSAPRIVRHIETQEDTRNSGRRNSGANSSFEGQSTQYFGNNRPLYRAPADDSSSSDEYLPKSRTNESNSDTSCVICFERSRRIAVFPCRHMSMCDVCAPRVVNQDGRCPVCREVIHHTCLIYM